MKTNIFILSFILLFSTSVQGEDYSSGTLQSTNHALMEAQSLSSDGNSSFQLRGGLMFGYYGGFGMNAQLLASDFAQDLPFMMRIGGGFSTINPGNSWEARKIFINNATNGAPEKSGIIWDARMDFIYEASWFKKKTTYMFFGPRYTHFKGNFEFINGNEVFDIISDQWGVGLGLEQHYRMNSNLEFIMSAGFDYYPPSTIEGHDTAYSPDGEYVNPREEFEYEDADKAIHQPKYQPRIMLGVNYRLK
ncbi:MAG: hypothetical protein GF372_04135 [Candidatus Marinimicrobia bacterium]|nr:hypothetical protein [Candidatus Neomarinimicrobiota bacterium]